MAINGENGVSAVTVDELLKQGLRIPNYQRPYSWDVSTALQLVDDISEALRDTERKDIPYVLGAIILHDDGVYLNVVDGQQRLLTLRMILAALDPINHQISMSGNSDTPVSLVWIELQRRLSQLEDKRSHRSFSPNLRYHLAAQAAMPLLSAWSVSSTHDARNAGRSRFQLDAPIIAGRSFFEMVTFMLDELKILEQEVIDRGFKNFGPSQSRYRYVYELFIAALLCYTNKFGDEDVDEVRNRLFAWAYALRVELLRVQFVSADNRARGKNDANKSPFVLLRNAMTGSVVRKLPITSKPYSDNHEKELVAFIKGLQ